MKLCSISIPYFQNPRVTVICTLSATGPVHISVWNKVFIKCSHIWPPFHLSGSCYVQGPNQLLYDRSSRKEHVNCTSYQISLLLHVCTYETVNIYLYKLLMEYYYFWSIIVNNHQKLSFKWLCSNKRKDIIQMHDCWSPLIISL